MYYVCLLVVLTKFYFVLKVLLLLHQKSWRLIMMTVPSAGIPCKQRESFPAVTCFTSRYCFTCLIQLSPPS